MMRRSIIRCPRSVRSSIAGAALLLLAGHAAHAQSVWSNPSGGSWGVPGNWNNGNVPDNTGESAVISIAGPYTVFLDNNYNISLLTLSAALARVDIPNNLNLGLSNGLDSTGILTVNNSAGGNATSIRVLNSQSWTGSGDVVLNANAGNLDTAYIYFNGGGEVLTLASGKEILGSGRVYVGMINNGGVVADSFGRVLELTSQPKTNNNEFAAINGGILQLYGIAVSQGSTGLLRSFTNSTVSVVGSNITGGKIQTDSGGSTQFTGVSSLTSLATSGAIDVLNNNEVRLVDSLVNDGDIRVNDGSGGNNAFIRAQNNVSLTGTGTITLRSNGTNLDTAYLYFNGGTEILTQGSQHTIRGSGNIYVGMINNGTISASTPGRSLRLTSVGKTNNKTISADSGRLEVDGTAITQGAAGVISLSSTAGASLVVRNAVINSGLLQSFVNAITIEGVSVFNGTSISGPMQVLNNQEMRLTGASTTHSGDLFVNSGIDGNATLIRVMQSHTLSGNGRIVLRAIPQNLDTAYLTYNGGSEILTQNAAHSIVGTGNIYVALDNAGLVSADQSGKVLQLLAVNKSNSAVMKSQSGGILLLSSVAVTQTGAGVLRADGGQIQMNAATVNSGLIESINGGTCDFSGSTVFNNVSFAGVGRVPNNNELRLTGGSFVNNGVLTINPTAGGNGTYARFIASETVSGSGSIVLNADSGNLDTAYLHYNGGGEIFTQAAGHTVRGTGRIYVGMTNNGLVSANVPGRTLEMTAITKNNNSTFEASGGGLLQFSSVTVNQGPGATIRAFSGGRLNFFASVISGGKIQSSSSSLADAAAFSAGTTLSAVTLEGASTIPNNNELRMTGSGLVNNGTLTVNSTAGGNGTFFRVQASAQIDGTGSIVLNADPANLDTAYLHYSGGGEILTLGSGQTLAGTGNIYVRTINYGLVAPGGNPAGTAIGRINLPAFRFTQTSAGIMAFEIAGPTASEFDRITGSATIDLAGSLIPSLINSYDPPIGTTYDIIDGPTVVGTFASVGPGFTAQYFPTKVRLTYTGAACPADLNHDGFVDDADFVIFVPAYNILDCSDPAMPAGCPADLNRDGVVDDADFVIFLAQYNALICPE